MTFWMVLTVLLSFFICSLGLQKGVERITKVMMAFLFFCILPYPLRAQVTPARRCGGAEILPGARFRKNGRSTASVKLYLPPWARPSSR